ncbi:hypothetical protein NSQ20_12400 [Paenibacillus sp. FSL K6-1122]|uniref:hypothetical protein n=1 Tax=Paenibacillus sp. FSL K6-1122 TaxID=2954512 RepID=UPI0030EC3D77
MNRNTRLQKSLDILNKSLEALNMAVDQQHLTQKADDIDQSVKEFFEVKTFLSMQKMKENSKEWRSNSTKRSNT